MSSTRDIDALIDLMARLPGLGPRSARRAVLHLIRKRALLLTPLADMMQTVAATARECINCGNVGTADICDICTSEKRANGEICVVEDVADLWAMERSGVFKGRYHVLGGTLSALDAIGPQELRIPRLMDRVRDEAVSEVILALNATIDGQTTAHYIADQLEGQVRLTSLAQGVPIGGELDYLDDGTITAAMRARKSISGRVASGFPIRQPFAHLCKFDQGGVAFGL
jgi:recombination protein RecR